MKIPAIFGVAAAIASLAGFSARAQGPAALELQEALALARGDQPSTQALVREAEASEEAAVAARTLPDPQLSAGVQNLPVTGNMAFDPRADEMTMYTIGVMREQVRRATREAEASRLRSEAVVSRTQASAQDRRIARDVMIAWIDGVEARAKQLLLERLIADLKAGQQVMEAGVPTGSATPALALQAQAEVALAEAELAKAAGDEARARAQLSRWIGPAAERPFPDRLPVLSPPVSTGSINQVAAHPQVAAAEAEETAARRQVGVAREEGKRELTWSVMYGWRPSYGDMVSAQVTIPLRINRSQKQDRVIAEASARADAARLRAEDMKRELTGSFNMAVAEYHAAEAQLDLLRSKAVPSLEASFAAAEARYAGGQGQLELPLNIVRRYVEVTVQLIEQQGHRDRAAAEIAYLTGGPVQ